MLHSRIELQHSAKQLKLMERNPSLRKPWGATLIWKDVISPSTCGRVRALTSDANAFNLAATEKISSLKKRCEWNLFKLIWAFGDLNYAVRAVCSNFTFLWLFLSFKSSLQLRLCFTVLWTTTLLLASCVGYHVLVFLSLFLTWTFSFVLTLFI